MKSKLVSGIHAAFAAVLTFGLIVPPAAYADPPPAGDKPPGAPGDKAPGEDDQLYSCHKKSGNQMTSVTFKPETELKDLIPWVMGFTCKSFVYDPRIVATGKKVTLISPEKMTPNEAYRMFLVALSTMGFTVVPKGNVLRIVESGTAKGETLPIMRNGVPANADEMVRYILKPSYAQAETIRGALDAMRSPSGNVAAVGNLIVITDFSSQVRDMMTLAKALDVPGTNESIGTIAVKYADAVQLSQQLNDILGISGAGAAASAGKNAPGRGQPNPPGAPQMEQSNRPATGGDNDISVAVPSRILVDQRTNTLIVVGSEAGFLRVKALVERLDIALDTLGTPSIHVYPLENAIAEELATVINNAVQGSNQKTGAAGSKPGTPGAPAIPQQQQQQPQQPVPVGAEGNLGAALAGQVRVIGDKATNSLIVVSNDSDFYSMREVIKRLDQPRRQVFIEALILEVQLDNTLTIGTSSHGGLPVGSSGQSLVLGGVQTSSVSSLNPASLATASGLLGGIIGSPLANATTFLGTSIPSYGVLFQALAGASNSNILSAPQLIAVNNEKAEFSVGNNIPYKAGLSFGGFGLPTSGSTSSTSSSALPGSIGQNIQRQDLNLTLNITPHISSNDAVRLEVEQETKDLGGTDAVLGPTWTERKLKTQVVVHDQQSVVIGGLIQDRDTVSVTKVPLLGDIPLLGYLFKWSSTEKKKMNLLILLTPYIIKDQIDLQQIRDRKMREYNEFAKSFRDLNSAHYDPKVDYKRKRGVVEEINRAVEAVEDDRALLNGQTKHVRPPDGMIKYAPSEIEAPGDVHTTPTPVPTPTPAPQPTAPGSP